MQRVFAASLAAALGLAGLTVLAAPAASAAVVTPPPVLRIMPLGDSITDGYTGSTGAGYRKPLAERIAAEGRFGADFVGSMNSGQSLDPDHEGHSTKEIEYLDANVVGWLDASQPDAVLLHIGINDLDRNHADGASGRMAGLITKIRQNRPTASVFVLGLIPNTRGREALVTTFNAEVKAGVDTRKDPKVRYLALPDFRYDGSNEVRDMNDDLHPADPGFQKMSDTFYGALKEAFTDRTLTRPVALRAGTEAGGADRVRWADWDGDGKPDYVVMNDNGSIVVYLNRGGEGHGDWLPIGQVSPGATTDRSRVRFADWDGDGRADYLLINPNGSVVVFLNDGGDGRGGWKDTYQVASGLTTDQTKVRFADFDGDGRADYLAFSDGGAVGVYLNRGGDGHGGWNPQGIVATGISADRSRVRFADFDGDGRADYGYVYGDGSVVAYLNRGGDRHGGWAGGNRITTGQTTDHTRVWFADFNGDAHADYLLAHPDNSTTAFTWNGGDGNGGWTSLGRIAAGA